MTTASDPPTPARPRLLVVDHDASVRELHALVLNLEGYEVETACNGASALERLAESDFQLVLTERDMPVLDGASMVQAMRSAGSEIPVVMITNSLEKSPLPPNVSDFIAGTIRKPAHSIELLTVVAKALGGKPSKRHPYFSQALQCEVDASGAASSHVSSRGEPSSSRSRKAINIALRIKGNIH